MLIRFYNEDTSWVYNDEAVVALVGKSATNQFDNITLSVDEIKSAFPFVCFDTPSKKDFDWMIYENEIENKLKRGMNDRLALCQTDMLFVLSDFDSNEDYDICVRYATQLKEDGLSFLVTHERNRKSDAIAQIGNKFRHVIFVENDVDNLFYPVKQLLVDYYRPSFIGIDMADVLSVYPRKRKRQSNFVRYSFPNITALKAFIPELTSWVKTKNSSFSFPPDFMLFMNVSQTTGLDDIEEIATRVMDDYYNSEIIWSCNFNSDKGDDSCTLLLQTVFPIVETE